MSVALTVAQIWSPGRRARASSAAGVISATSGTSPCEPDPDAVGVAVDVGDGGGPDVAGAAVGRRRVEGDAVGLDDGEGGALDVVGGDDARRRWWW